MKYLKFFQLLENNQYQLSGRTISDKDISFALGSFIGAYIVARRYGYQDFIDSMILTEDTTIYDYARLHKDSFDEWASIMKKAYAKENLNIFRGLSKEASSERIGNCWTLKRSVARTFGPYIEEGVTSHDNVDWLMCIVLGIINLFNPEFEIRVIDDSKIKLL